MKTRIEIIRNKVYQSEILPDIQTTNPNLARTIEWADQHPIIWDIVTHRKSKAFGLGSSVYIGWAQRRTEPDAILERARHMHDVVESLQPYYPPDSIFVWRAKFTMNHYRDKGFTGGLFQQYSLHYAHSCLMLDYTPKTLQDVIDVFCAWMDRHYQTLRIALDGQTVRTFPESQREEAQ